MPWSYLWQNFLINPDVIENIILELKKINRIWYNTIIEIWPWKWAITNWIIKFFDKIFLIEKDTSFWWMKHFHSRNVSVLWKDILNVWYDEINSENAFMFWNLPYYISSPILKRFFFDYEQFDYWIFMVQKELWEKLISCSTKKPFLWRLLNYNYDVEYLFDISSSAFSPIPKVDSCLIKLTKKYKKIICIDKYIFLEFLSIVNMYKRKTIWKIFKILQKNFATEWNIIIINTTKISIEKNLFNKRLEELDWSDINKLLVANRWYAK